MATQTLTVLISDIEGSTELWELYPQEMNDVVAAHFDVMRRASVRYDGRVVRESGDGALLAFTSAADALAAANHAATSLRDLAVTGSRRVRVRMGINTGECHVHHDDVFGRCVNHAARLESLANGGQVLVGASTAAVVAGADLGDIDLLDLGTVPLRGVSGPVQCFQLLGPGMRRDHPPIVPSADRRQGVPSEATSIVGRHHELEHVRSALEDVRMVTLVGGPGVGKSRIAIRLAHEITRPFTDGVWFAPIERLETGEIESALATLVGLGAGAPLRLVAERLSSDRSLLILDGCDHLAPEVRRVCSELLSSCARIGILATSRVELELDDEFLVPIGPLESPEPSRLSRTDLERCDGVRVLQRALSGRGVVLPDDLETLRALGWLAHLADGVPLTLEMLAARLEHQAPTELADDIAEERTTVGSTSALRRIVARSWSTLTDRECTLIRAVAVCRGPVDDATIFAMADGVGRGDVASVSRRSMLQRTAQFTRPRYHVLRPVREYAREMTPQHEWGRLVSEHTSCFRARAAQDAPKIHTSGARSSVDRLAADLDDHRFAVRNLLAGGRYEEAAPYVNDLFYFMHFRGHTEVVDWARSVLDHLPIFHPDYRRLCGASAMGYFLVGDLAGAVSVAERALELPSEQKPGDEIFLRMVLVNSAAYAPDSTDAARHFAAFVRDSEATGDAFWIGHARGYQALSAAALGRTDDAIELAESSLKMALDLDNDDSLQWALFALGSSVARQDPRKAVALLARATEAARSIGSSWNLLVTLDQLARLQLAVDDVESAARTLIEVIDLIGHVGNASQIGQAFELAGRVLDDIDSSVGLPLLERAKSRPHLDDDQLGVPLDARNDGIELSPEAHASAVSLRDRELLQLAREALEQIHTRQ